jgi:hypothetical protein
MEDVALKRGGKCVKILTLFGAMPSRTSSKNLVLFLVVIVVLVVLVVVTLVDEDNDNDDENDNENEKEDSGMITVSGNKY